MSSYELSMVFLGVLTIVVDLLIALVAISKK